MHHDAWLAVQRLRPSVVARVYEVGSLLINGSVRTLFQDAEEYHGVDVVAGDGVDAVANGATYTPPFVPDCVVCCEVLEHTAEAAALVQQCGRVVCPGGVVLVTCAGPGRKPHSAVDGEDLRHGEFYMNVHALALADWMTEAGLERVTVDVGIGEWRARLPVAFEVPGDLYAVGYKPHRRVH